MNQAYFNEISFFLYAYEYILSNNIKNTTTKISIFYIKLSIFFVYKYYFMHCSINMKHDENTKIFSFAIICIL